MITIEEAHKFLNSDAARQTTFVTIARELRKFYLTMLVVDPAAERQSTPKCCRRSVRASPCSSTMSKDIDAIFTGVKRRLASSNCPVHAGFA